MPWRVLFCAKAPAAEFRSSTYFLVLVSLLLSAPVAAQQVQSDSSYLRLDQAGAQWFVTSSPIDPARESEGDRSDAGWVEMKTPGNLGEEGSPFRDQESVWYRRDFEWRGESDGIPFSLRLGEIADRDRTYLNGAAIGQTGDWESPNCQAYDRQRLYEIPPGLLRRGHNTLLVQVRGCIPGELGIYRDRIELRPTRDLLRDFYLENVSQTLSLAVYLTFAIYFALFYLRRRQERENLYFSLFLLAFTIYGLLRTQWKYEFGLSLHDLKRIQTISVVLTLPLFYEFIRAFFRRYDERLFALGLWRDRTARTLHILNAAAVILIALHPSNAMWQYVLFTFIQPGWLLYTIAILFIAGHASWRRDLDAALMLSASLVLAAAFLLDVLAGKGVINLPTVLTYAFTIFVLAMSLVLANRFVRLHDETERLNVDLTRFNQASRRFVPFEFLNLLQRSNLSEVALGDQVQKEMTILFSDIRSFTNLSETMTPKENFDFINSYMRRMGPIVRAHNGFIDKYIGDAIMALFPQSPADAVAAVLEMRAAMQEWNQARARHNFPIISVGFGVHSGRLMLGTIGENERMEGTVISDDVNLASRVESATKYYGATALITDAVAAALPHGLAQLRYLGRVRVKGKSAPVALYELLFGDTVAEQTRLRLRQPFEQAVRAYEERQFDRAESLFRSLTDQDSADLAARLFLERARDASLQGRPPDWDGADQLSSK
ncbi:MAG: adenylate/guanylate cyclase domain-containing protein [Leptospirales bacterium]|nr:adenylate/guanylate cyclase domain-containing protein [Leptospirales bacterium]